MYKPSKPIRKLTALAGLLSPLLLLLSGPQPQTAQASTPDEATTAGGLAAMDARGKALGPCPLKHTDVKADVTGPLARVTVTQEFQNPYSSPIEAVYIFPLPANSAVDDMTMLIGDRRVKAAIKPRDEAQKIYENAKQHGQTASLLNQERPNIFTQAVANILPGQSIKIEIRYVENLSYDDGTYRLTFPMVVGPRYIPGEPTGKQGTGWAPDTDRVNDASRITPLVAAKGQRAGHDISLQVALHAGVSLEDLHSKTHDVAINRTGASEATIALKDQASIPNKDFILEWTVAGRQIKDAVLTHHDQRGGFFTLMLTPPKRVAPTEATPKEIVFVIDTSGSMMGYPLDKAKEAMNAAIANLNPRDTFNLITFSGDTHLLFPAPVPATAAHIAQAKQFLDGNRGGGGTEMMKAIKASLDPSDEQDHIRIVCFMTDGYVGNDMEIIGEVQRHPNARVFSFGIGSSVNHFLLDKMSEYGRGEVEYVGLNEDGSAAAKRFHERVQSPLLTDITIDWNGLPVEDALPGRLNDLFSAKPLILAGRYTHAAKGVIKIHGKQLGRPVVREVEVNFPDRNTTSPAIATLWARNKVDSLMAQDWDGLQRGQFKDALKSQVTDLGVKFHLMTQFTSLVAVEEKIVNKDGQPMTVEVPVEMPEGVSHEGVFGERQELDRAMAVNQAPTVFARRMAGFSGGYGNGVNAPMAVAPPPPPPPVMQDKPGDALRMKAARRADLKTERDQRQVKLHPTLVSIAAKVAARQQLSPAEQSLVKRGRVRINITVLPAALGNSPALKTVAQLQALGFVLVKTDASTQTLTGDISIDKLDEMLAVSGVLFAAPTS